MKRRKFLKVCGLAGGLLYLPFKLSGEIKTQKPKKKQITLKYKLNLNNIGPDVEYFDCRRGLTCSNKLYSTKYYKKLRKRTF